MPSTSPLDYRNILDSFKARRLSDRDIEQHLFELVLIFDFAASLNRASGIPEIADLLLLTLMGYTASPRSIFLLRTKDDIEVIASKGESYKSDLKNLECSFSSPYPEYYLLDRKDSSPYKILCEQLGVRLMVPLQFEGQLLGFVGLGSPMESRSYTHHELQIVLSLVQMCASAVQNAKTNQTLQVLNRQLILKVYQLNTLFELSKDFYTVWDSESIFRILGTSLIGQLMISRCAVFTLNQGIMELRFLRGARLSKQDVEFASGFQPASIFKDKFHPVSCKEMEHSVEKEFCFANKINLVFPMMVNDEIKGLIYLGEKKNKLPFTKEDYDFIATLGNLALAADDNTRMQHQIIEKQRMEKELSIAREIQLNLLPQSIPEVDGYEFSTGFYPAYQVGGDYFDFIPVSEKELAVAIGDVSGKSTPAALIMASLQASLRALASLEVTNPKVTIQKINQLLCESHTASNKYVTFFYGILNHLSHEFFYVNAGHCYPLVIKRDGKVDRLETGGMVMGFFKEVQYRSAVYQLAPGDLMILYTDGVSELIDPAEEEFGIERIIDVLKKHQPEPITAIREALVRALEEHRQNQDQWDDITFILLKRL